MFETFVQASEPSSYTAWAKMSRSRLLSVSSAASSMATATAADILPNITSFNSPKHSATSAWFQPSQPRGHFPHASTTTGGSFSTAMYLSAFAPLLLLPYAAAAGVHKLKLKKIESGPTNPSLESLYL